MGGSSRSSMRGFLMWDSGLVRGVTLFLLIKVPGPLFTSCCTRSSQIPGFRAFRAKTQPLVHVQTDLRSVSVGVHCFHIQINGLHFAAISNRGELENSVEGALQVGHLLWPTREKNEMSWTSLEKTQNACETEFSPALLSRK